MKICDESKKGFEAKSLYGRPADVYSIVDGIYKHFTGEITLGAYLMEREEFENETGKEDEKIKCILEYLLEAIEDTQTDPLEINTSDIAERVNEKLYSQKDYDISPKGIVSLLKKERILDQSSRSRCISTGTRKGVKVWDIKRKKIIDSIERSHFQELKERVQNLPLEADK